MKHTTIRQIMEWFKTMDENQHGRRAYFPIDARRVAHFVNNGLDATLPESISRTNPNYEYKLERRLAEDYMTNVLKLKLPNENDMIVEEESSVVVVTANKGRMYIVPEGSISLQTLKEFKNAIVAWFKQDGYSVSIKPIELDAFSIENPEDQIDYMTLIAFVVDMKRKYNQIKRVNKNKYKFYL